MSTLIDALKGLLKEMHGSVEPDVSFYRDELSEIIAEHERSAGWQPIETAPKDGTRVILWVTNSDRPKTKHGSYDSYYRAFLSDDRLICLDATHWQRLPKGPTE